MGRLFWKFFLSILLAQLAATVGIGGAVWLKNRSAAHSATADIDTSPPAEMAIASAAATLEFGGPAALRRLLGAMEHHRVYAVNGEGHELLDREVSAAMLAEARQLLAQHEQRPVVRQLKGNDGQHYLLFLPSHTHLGAMGGGDPGAMLAMARLAGGPIAGAGLPGERGPPGEMEHGPAGPGGPPPGYLHRAPPDGPGAGLPPPDAGQAPGSIGPGGSPRARDGGDRPPPDGRGPGPRFQPLAPYVPLVAAVLASLLFAVLLAWYFSRPIRALRQAFDAAAGGDLAPRFAATGKGNGKAGGRNGSELNDLGRDFDRMTARLRSLIDGQTRLLHDVSHELRSPLARLQAAIGLAHQQPDKIAASMERIERESVRMDKLVGELLTLARLEAGALSAGLEEISMADLLDEIVDDASFEATSQQRTLLRDGEADVMVSGQPDLLARAIENVVRNAIKHSPEHGVVQLQIRPWLASGQLCIRVLDNGPGVAPADLEAIFQPFFRSSSTHKDTDGHGLGLAIAQHVIRDMGGSINASNRAEGGLCVEIVLPVVPQPAAR